jgi:hypothetical protein
MTLAALLCVSMFYRALAMPLSAASSRQDSAQTQSTDQTNQPQTAPQSQNQSSAPAGQTSPPASNPPAASNPATSPAKGQTPAQTGQKPAAAHPVHHKKKPAQGDCNSTTTAAKPGSSGSSAPSSTNPASGGNDKTAASASASSNCPPIRVIVQQGGTTEPSIELAGSEGTDQASRDRNAATQMLAVTQTNLKKIEGRTLTAPQQNTVKQIRQFMEDSNHATAAGDLERARTLAWKAQLLSEDLVNPPK